jgi:hypothetical protein
MIDGNDTVEQIIAAATVHPSSLSSSNDRQNNKSLDSLAHIGNGHAPRAQEQSPPPPSNAVVNGAPSAPRQKKLGGAASSSSVALSHAGSYTLQGGAVEGEIVPVKRAPFALAFRVLLHRSWLNFSRQPLLVMTRVFQVMAFAVILTLYYARLGSGQASVQNRLGLVQEFTALMFIGQHAHTSTQSP